MPEQNDDRHDAPVFVQTAWEVTAEDTWEQVGEDEA